MNSGGFRRKKVSRELDLSGRISCLRGEMKFTASLNFGYMRYLLWNMLVMQGLVDPGRTIVKSEGFGLLRAHVRVQSLE
jgi:hypothetical protein